MQHSPRYDVDRIVRDAHRKGWMPVDLIRKARVSIATGYRFLNEQVQTPKTAAKLSKALGKEPGEYLIEEERVA